MVIIEKQAKGAGRDAHRYVRSLASYMETAKHGTVAEEYGLTLAVYMRKERDCSRTNDRTERVLATGARVNGNAALWDVALAELHARMAKRSSRSKKPAHHIVGSVQAGENPDANDCNEIAHVLAEELGCDDGVILWALHGDTGHRHLHLLVLTLGEDGSATPFGFRGRSHEAMQRTIARVEQTCGFAREPGFRYEVVDGAVRRTAPVPTTAKRRAPIRTEVLQWETETGLESFTRYAQTELAALLEEAGSWHDAQAALAPRGAQVVKAGSGGEIQSGDGAHHVKLSNVDRKLSWNELIHRWGDWCEPTIEPTAYVPRVRDPERAAHWAKRDEQAEALHGSVQARLDRLQAERRAALDRMWREHAGHRADLSAIQGEPLDIARLRAGLKALYGRRAEVIDSDYRSRIPALRDLRGEIADTAFLDDVHLDDIGLPDCSLEIAWGLRSGEAHLPRGFVAVQVGECVQYWRDDDAARAPTFVERGDRIWINNSSDDGLRAALILAKARYGLVAAHGDAAFIAQARRLGRELGIEVQQGVEVKPRPLRRRSPRIQQYRDAVRQWQEAHASPRDDHPRVRGWSGIDMPQHERSALLARVRRFVAEQDWDPRDFRRGRSRDRDISRSSKPVEPRRQQELERAGRAAALNRKTGGPER
ncbi:hypothetical protein SPAN111604_14835 [Sphingomonas antarctica]|uniref:relaxase/mobilization nuclease domain-containing protein n=1 Tax=Sphingomonas antarctica TaxID=2040274 RepID=UPI0039EA3F74